MRSSTLRVLRNSSFSIFAHAAGSCPALPSSFRARHDELRRKILVGAMMGAEPRGPGRRAERVLLMLTENADARPGVLWLLEKLSAHLQSCVAQKAGGLPIPANPARRMRRALFFTPRTASSRPHRVGWPRRYRVQLHTAVSADGETNV
jgi:hypothetical protein